MDNVIQNVIRRLEFLIKLCDVEIGSSSDFNSKLSWSQKKSCYKHVLEIINEENNDYAHKKLCKITADLVEGEK